MKIWTTFAPQKISWEITTIRNAGKAGSSNWLRNKTIIDESLLLLKQSGISGIRLVIFPSEITEDGKTFNWKPVDEMLGLCHKHHIHVDLCIGPFQFPHYPGIYLPNKLMSWDKYKGSGDKTLILDTFPFIQIYGMRFLKLQMERYGEDSRIHGFHLANEWPDRQAVFGKEDLKLTVSRKFMLEAAALLKRLTNKPISLNTNIDAADRSKVFSTFNDILAILGEQGKLGFDIYPSQETWEKAPLEKIRRLFGKYSRSVAWCSNKFYPAEIYFAEVEAQPWGNGSSWYRLINNKKNSEEKVLKYTRSSLSETFKQYISATPCETISLWGSDFWLSAHEMGIDWPLESVKELH